MMGSTKILSGMAWRFAERICAQLVTFIVSIVLARILMPEHYGIIAMTTVFITICNVFVTSGFGMALIQKENADDLDFTTILVFSLLMSIVLYMILFLIAPVVSSFYNEPILIPILRIMSLKLPLAAINSVQQAYVSRKMMFRKFFWATLIGTVVSAIVGIAMAYAGYGVWALAAQYLINSFMDTIILGLSIRWYPQIRFSLNRLKAMIGFGWRILCSDFLHTCYTQLRSVVIGKQYSSDQLAFYNRGQQIPHIFVTNVGVAISTVLFPAMSTEQNERAHLRHMLKRSISLGTFAMMPIMAGLAAVAKPLIVLLMTEKWVFAVPYMQLACIEFCVEPWANANLQAIKAQGHSKTYLKMEVIKKTFALTILLLAIPRGVYAIAASSVLYTVVDLFIDAIANKHYLDYGPLKQLKDTLPNLVSSLIVFMIVYSISLISMNYWKMLIVQTIAGVAMYVAMSVAFHNESFSYLLLLLKSFVRKG